MCLSERQVKWQSCLLKVPMSFGDMLWSGAKECHNVAAAANSTLINNRWGLVASIKRLKYVKSPRHS